MMHETVVVDFVCNVRECIVSALPFSWIAEVHYDEEIGFIRKGVDKKKERKDWGAGEWSKGRKR